MFTTEELEATWKQLSEYERNHFGLKFGADFPAVAEILRQSKQFLTLGNIVTMLAAMDMSALHQDMRGADETARRAKASEFMERPNTMHSQLAEIFYLGYELGRKTGEITALEKIATSK
jgi:hypothetical protein